jgi:hypothetical protein
MYFLRFEGVPTWDIFIMIFVFFYYFLSGFVFKLIFYRFWLKFGVILGGGWGLLKIDVDLGRKNGLLQEGPG